MEVNRGPPRPPGAGDTFARVVGIDRLTLHAARPADLAPFAAAYVVAGSLVVHLEQRDSGDQPSGAGLDYVLPAQDAKVQAYTVQLDGLPSLASVLVECGAQPLARYVLSAPLAELDAQTAAKTQALTQAQAQVAQARTAYQRQRDALAGELAALSPERDRLHFLVAHDAEPRQSLEAVTARVQAVQSKQTDLAVSYSGTAADAQVAALGRTATYREMNPGGNSVSCPIPTKQYGGRDPRQERDPSGRLV
jgi:hypothetical protein